MTFDPHNKNTLHTSGVTSWKCHSRAPWNCPAAWLGIQEDHPVVSQLNLMQISPSTWHDARWSSCCPPVWTDGGRSSFTPQPVKVLIADAMGFLQSMKKTSTMLTSSNLQNAFDKCIEKTMTGYDEGRVVFDWYMYQSLKNKNSTEESNYICRIRIHPEMKLTMSIKKLLSASSTKKKLTCLLVQGLLEFWILLKRKFFQAVCHI